MDNNNVPIVFYDGACQLCAKSVQAIMKYERAAELKFAPLYGNTYSEYIGKSTERSSPESFLVYSQGQIFRESAAFFQLTAYLIRPLSALSIFKFLPRFFTDYMYRIVANNRYKLFGKVRDECMIHPDHQRFLD